ncbi:MAG: hypothetical protein ACRDEA_04620, partial [Microcystaceae cyanobacterium]
MTQTLKDNQTLKENWSVSEIESLLGLHLADEDKKEHSELIPDTTQVLSDGEVKTKVEGEGGDDAKTKQKRLWLSKNPYAKLTLIALIVGCGALFLGFVLSGATSLNFRPSTVTAAGEKKTDGSQQAKPDSLEQRNAQLTGELALSQQKQQMQAIREDLDNRPDDPNLPKPQIEKPSATGQPTTVSTASTVTASSSPTRYRAQHVVPIAPRPGLSLGRTTQPQPTTYSKARAQPQLTQTASGDPLEQWQQLAQLGSYGKGNNENNASGILLEADESDLSREGQEQEEQTTQLANNSSNQLSLEGTLGQVANGKFITPLVWVQALVQGEGETILEHLSQ